MIEKNPLLKLSFEFSLLVLTYCDLLDQMHKYAISKQLVRAGTSVGANAMEAQNAESKADFIHKIKIAAKEADETQYWLALCEFASGYPDSVIVANKLTQLQKIINAILGTAKRKTPFSYFLSFFIF
ncbi:MAG: four helix bundle protein [Ferruginibacter sp.]|nr:four helix bundle protein [Ferruginibacter sp.]